MKIIIVDKMERFRVKQIKELQRTGEVLFTSLDRNALNTLPKNIYKDEVILMPDPDVFEWNLGKKELRGFKKLKAICLPTTAFDWIDTEYCRRNNIVICNNPHYSTEAVAEYAIWMMLSLARKTPLMINGSLKSFDQKALQTETRQKVMGIIGLGNIGTRIAEYGDRMGMRVIYHSKSKKDTFFQKVSLKKLLKTADFIFPTFAVNKQTKQLLTKENINLIKPTSFIISIIDKNAINYAYLVRQVNQEKLAGFAYETTTFDGQRKYKKNILAVPPLAWYSKESLERCYESLTETIISATTNNPINRVF